MSDAENIFVVWAGLMGLFFIMAWLLGKSTKRVLAMELKIKAAEKRIAALELRSRSGGPSKVRVIDMGTP